MTRTISILNQKGGVGKTTTSVNLANVLGSKDYKVLVIDLDPQANSTDMLINIVDEEGYTFVDSVLEGKEEAVTYPTVFANVDLLPSRLDLATTEKNILISPKAQHNRLYKGIKGIMKQYDFIIIDCPPILNMLTVNALNVSDEVIIPIKIDKAAEKGFEMTLRNIKDMSESYDLDIAYKVLFTMVTRTNVDKLKIEEISNACDAGCVIQTHIRNQAKPIKEATYSQKSIINAKTGVGNDYVDLVNELLEEW